MGVGGRNRLMTWTGMAVPVQARQERPARHDAASRGGLRRRLGRRHLGEGRIHRGERDLLPLSEGAAYFALRAGVPIVPIAINGTSWLGFGGRVRVRVGEPLVGEPADRPARPSRTLTERVSQAILGAHRRPPDPPPPGRFGRWLTDAFNDWPREATPLPCGIRSCRRGDRAIGAAGGRPAPDRAALAYSRRHPTRPGGPWPRPACPPTRTSTAPASPSRATNRSTPGRPELMRDVAIRRGVLQVVEDFRDGGPARRGGFERVFASGGGPPAAIGRDARGPADGPRDHALRARAGHPLPGGRRAPAAHRVPRRQLRRARLRLSPRRRPRRSAAPAASGLG